MSETKKSAEPFGALRTALLESETKESLADMVIELRAARSAPSSALAAAEAMREKAAVTCDALVAGIKAIDHDSLTVEGLAEFADVLRALPLPQESKSAEWCAGVEAAVELVQREESAFEKAAALYDEEGELAEAASQRGAARLLYWIGYRLRALLPAPVEPAQQPAASETASPGTLAEARREMKHFYSSVKERRQSDAQQPAAPSSGEAPPAPAQGETRTRMQEAMLDTATPTERGLLLKGYAEPDWQARALAAEAECDELKRERDEALLLVEGPSTLRDLAAYAGSRAMELVAAEAEVKRLREALTDYGNAENWYAFRIRGLNRWRWLGDGHADMDSDPGRTARAALSAGEVKADAD